jgi:hypothetical protein
MGLVQAFISGLAIESDTSNDEEDKDLGNEDPLLQEVVVDTVPTNQLANIDPYFYM